MRTPSDSSGHEQEVTPSLQLVKNDIEDKLTIASAEPGDLFWSDFEFTGDCVSSRLGTSVVAGDTITDCTGVITIRHIPTNTLIGK